VHRRDRSILVLRYQRNKDSACGNKRVTRISVLRDIYSVIFIYLQYKSKPQHKRQQSWYYIHTTQALVFSNHSNNPTHIMWSALSSDLKEFVSTVAEDTNEVLSAIDSKLTDEEKRRGIATPMKGGNGEDGDGSGVGVGVPGGEDAGGSSPVDEGQAAAASRGGEVMIGVDGDVIYDGGGAEGGFDATGLVAAAADEVARLRGLEETYTAPLLPNEDDFVNEKPKATAEAKDADTPTEEKDEEEGGTATAVATEVAGKDDADDVEDGWGDDLGDDVDTDIAEDKPDEAMPSPPELTEEQEQKAGIALDGDDSSTEISEEDDDEEYKEVRAFLANFDIESKTDDIAAVLERYPDTVKVNFENLVPTAVAYEQFWQRYYYRCDEGRVVRAWEAEQERARIARQEAISAGVASVKNLGNSLFGGAVRALGNVSQVVAPPSAAAGSAAAPASSGSSAYEKFQAEFKEQQRAEAVAASGGSGSSGGVAAGIGSAIFGTSGRPPFVMNTAQDDDEYEEGSVVGSEEDEEELGWSDDDDDLDDLEEEVEVEDMEKVAGNDEDDTEEQIEFAPANTEEAERLQSLLSTTEEERDQLHQTIELQRKEIEKLREAVPAPPTDAADGDSVDEIEKLKLQIFEKDSELAAMRASAMDSSHWVESPTKDKGVDSSRVDASELEEIQQELAEKNNEIADLKKQVANLTFEAKQNNADLYVAKGKLEELATAKEDAVGSAAELEARMASEVTAKDEEITRLTEEAAAAADKAKAELTAAMSKLNEALAAADEGTSQNSADLEARVASEVAAKDEEIAQLKEEITNLAFEAKQANSDLASARSGLEEAIAAAEEKASQNAADLEARMTSAVAAKDEEITRLREEAEAATAAAEESSAELSAAQSQLEEANVANALLKGEIQSLSGSTSETHSQLEELRASLAESEAKLSSVTEAAISEQEDAENKIQTLVAQLEDAKQASKSSNVRSASLEEEVQKLREEMEKQGIEFAHTLEEEIAKVKAENEVTSMSSGEKIESVSPVPQTPAASTSPNLSAERFSTPAADEEEDDEGWGDDWGSDDDL